MNEVGNGWTIEGVEIFFYSDPLKGGFRGQASSYYYLWVAIKKGYISVYEEAYNRTAESTCLEYSDAFSGGESHKHDLLKMVGV